MLTMMSMTKRILFGNDPRDDAVRERMRAETSNYLSGFPHRIAMNRRNPTGATHWDTSWRMSLEAAARELQLEVVRINGGMFTREEAQRDSLRSRAEAIWTSKRASRS
jgi:hypothetical protein